jgi:hypothetical protein
MFALCKQRSWQVISARGCFRLRRRRRSVCFPSTGAQSRSRAPGPAPVRGTTGRLMISQVEGDASEGLLIDWPQLNSRGHFGGQSDGESPKRLDCAGFFLDRGRFVVDIFVAGRQEHALAGRSGRSISRDRRERPHESPTETDLKRIPRTSDGPTSLARQTKTTIAMSNQRIRLARNSNSNSCSLRLCLTRKFGWASNIPATLESFASDVD